MTLVMTSSIKVIIMNEFLTHFENASLFQWGLVAALMLFVWFLSVLLAFFFNRRHLKYIAVACVPAGLSIVAWSAVLLWAVTGKAVEKYLPKKVKANLS